MALFYHGKNYETKEEIKELLEHHVDEINGTVVAFDPEDEETKNVSLKEFVQMVGLDAAAEIFSSNVVISKEVKTDMNNLDNLMEKQIRGEFLTEEEKAQLFAMLTNLKQSGIMHLQKDIYDTLLKILYDNRGNVMTSGLIGLFITFLTPLVSSVGSRLLPFKNDTKTLMDIGMKLSDDILKLWKDSMTQEMSPDMMALGLIFALGQVTCRDKNNFFMKPIDFDFLAKRFDLDKEFIFSCPGCNEDRSCNVCEKAGTMDESDDNCDEDKCASCDHKEACDAAKNNMSSMMGKVDEVLQGMATDIAKTEAVKHFGDGPIPELKASTIPSIQPEASAMEPQKPKTVDVKPVDIRERLKKKGI
jgi:hypothetical protein